MYKKLIPLSVFTIILINSACGPAAEDRAYMVKRGKEVQDSISNAIKIAISVADMPNMPSSTTATTPVKTTPK
jgi:hypothetical protein